VPHDLYLVIIDEIITQQQYHPCETDDTKKETTHDIGLIHSQPEYQYDIQRKAARQDISRYPFHELRYPLPGVYTKGPVAVYQQFQPYPFPFEIVMYTYIAVVSQ